MNLLLQEALSQPFADRDIELPNPFSFNEGARGKQHFKSLMNLLLTSI